MGQAIGITALTLLGTELIRICWLNIHIKWLIQCWQQGPSNQSNPTVWAVSTGLVGNFIFAVLFLKATPVFRLPAPQMLSAAICSQLLTCRFIFCEIDCVKTHSIAKLLDINSLFSLVFPPFSALPSFSWQDRASSTFFPAHIFRHQSAPLLGSATLRFFSFFSFFSFFAFSAFDQRGRELSGRSGGAVFHAPQRRAAPGRCSPARISAALQGKKAPPGGKPFHKGVETR